MRHTPPLLGGLVLCSALGLTQVALAQPRPSPTIHRVTVQTDVGVLTVTGAALGPDLLVTVDGQPVATLPGASDTQIEVLAPASVLTTPGTYRLTVVDPVRRLGDAFVVAAGQGWASGSAIAVDALSDWRGTESTVGRMPAAASADSPAAPPTREGVMPHLVEGSSNTAVGFQALVSNTGIFDTAVGVSALYNNTTGWHNSAHGHQALFSNTTGSRNTASGMTALLLNTSGNDNTATGYVALLRNTTGSANTAGGAYALLSNTTGASNAAAGAYALYTNTTGAENTASGHAALYGNTTGASNTASGVEALYANTTGANNTATGVGALAGNTTGSGNVAVGHDAGFAATAGSYNLFLGAGVTGTAADTNTTRIGLRYDGGTGVGQNKTFIAGIHGTQLTGGYLQVVVDANGQLGTLTPPVQLAGSAAATPLAVLQLQVQEQQATIAELRIALARLEALVMAGRGATPSRVIR